MWQIRAKPRPGCGALGILPFASSQRCHFEGVTRRAFVLIAKPAPGFVECFLIESQKPAGSDALVQKAIEADRGPATVHAPQSCGAIGEDGDVLPLANQHLAG